jgi:predicted transposase/invertase (TIGR01784 family)
MSIPDKYVSPLTDFGFKRLFGTESNKELLIDLLNQVLPPCHQVKELSYANSERLGATAMHRKAVFDLYCTAPDGARFVVEMQKAPQNFFKDRSVYYSTFPIQEQSIQGDWDFRLSAVYTLGILDFIFDEDKDDNEVRHVVVLKNQNCEVFYDKLTFIYLELPKFRKTEAELETRFDKWMYALRHLSQFNAPPAVLHEPIFQKLFEAASTARFSPDELFDYRQSLKYYRDMRNVINTSLGEGMAKGMAKGMEKGMAQGMEEGVKEGMKEGIAKGLAEGRKEEKRATARNAIQLGLDDASVAKITGLSKAEVARLRKKGGM